MLKAIVILTLSFQAFAQWGNYEEEWKLLESKARSDESSEIISSEYQNEIADLEGLTKDRVQTRAAALKRKPKDKLESLDLNQLETAKKKKRGPRRSR